MDIQRSEAFQFWITFASRLFPGWAKYGLALWAAGTATAFYIYQAEFGFAGRIVFGIAFAWAWLGVLVAAGWTVRRRQK